MKKTCKQLALVGLTFLLGCGFGNSNRQSISVKKTANTYEFEATYPAEKTAKVSAYLASRLKGKKLFDADGYSDSDLNLGDTMKFHLKAKLGFISISFKKDENSFPAYRQLESFCTGIKGVLK
jgi:hypothetical protein